MDKLRNMEVMVAVVEAGSFAAAARQLQISAVMVGKHIQQLETHLGARLFQRSTRQNSLTEVGAAFWYGFAFGDAVFYIPLMALGLIGFAKGREWGRPVLIAAMGITVYWPIVCLAAVVAARGASGWNLPGENEYWIVLPVITAWAVWALWWLIARPGNAEPIARS